MTPTPLELLLSGRYQELLARMRSPAARSQLLAEVVGSLAPEALPAGGAEGVLAQRQMNMLAAGDWSWGLLTPAQRRDMLRRDVALLIAPGRADGAAEQAAALRRLRKEMGQLYATLDAALQEGDLAWLLPLAEHLATIQEVGGDFASMQERYSALLAAALRLRSAPLELHARLGLALAGMRLGRLPEAAAEAALAQGLARQQRAESLLAAALHIEGSALAMAGDYAAGRERLEEALTLRRRRAERKGEISSMGNLAYVEQCLGRPAESAALLEAALGLCRELGDQRGEAGFLQNLGALRYAAGDYGGALGLARQALTLYRTMGDRPGEAAALSAQGFAAYGAGAHAEAQALQTQARELYRALGDRDGETLALLALGNLAYLVEATDTADRHYRQALEQSIANGDRQFEARARCGLAHLDLSRQEFGAAAGRYAEALRIFTECAEPAGMADCLIYAAAFLAGWPAATPAQLALAVRALTAAQAQALALQHGFDPLDQQILVRAGDALAQASSTGRLKPADAKANAPGSDETLGRLAELVLAELRAIA